jgi:hypothetical protein
MKLAFITNFPTYPASFYYWGGLRHSESFVFFKNGMNLNDFDACLVMTYDHEVVKIIRSLHPNILIGLADPRNYKVTESTLMCDFLVCDSIEMEDYWRKSGKPIFRYVEYPDIPTIEKTHKDSRLIRIGYHGNQIHLDCMSESVTPAINELAKKYNLELLVMHNGEPPTGHERWYPKGVKVIHTPWSMENYQNHLSTCDIGIAPNNLIHNDTQKDANSLNSSYNYSPDDYSLRFKMPSNPGRFVIFGKLGIPCVADFYPSALQILDGTNGYVAHNPQGWYWSLEQLIKSKELRQELGENLQKIVKERFDFKKQNDDFLLFLEGIKK